MDRLERYFRLRENGTTLRTKIAAGVTTFLTIAYIIFVQPAVLSGSMFGKPTGMDFGAIMTATCLSAALATALMAIYAQSHAQAPGMGENFLLVFRDAGGCGCGIPKSMGGGAGGGIHFGSIVPGFVADGFAGADFQFNQPEPEERDRRGDWAYFIAFIGLQEAGLIVKDPGTAVRMNAHFASPDLVVFFAGLLVVAVHTRTRFFGALGATLLAMVLKVSLPHFYQPTRRRSANPA